MRKIIITLHISLDGFAGGPNGEMDWIRLDDEMFDLVGAFTEESDTAIYGRITWQMMDNYWPNAANQPNATKHDKEHSAWYNRVKKIVLSRSYHGLTTDKTTFLGDNVIEEITKLKEEPGKNILIFGSPTAANTLMAHNLIDEYWLFINPVLLGMGIPVFPTFNKRVDLKQISSKAFPCGVTGIHYAVSQ
jgi:dihydrofolate reductase